MNVYSYPMEIESPGRNRQRRRLVQQYVDGMAQSFAKAMADNLWNPTGLLGVVFANTHPDAWATLIEGLLGSRSGTRRILAHRSPRCRTKVSGLGTRPGLSTSVWMACRKREEGAGEAFVGDVLEEMRPVDTGSAALFLEQGHPRARTFFISAIGPALSVFGRHSRVLRPDGAAVTVRDFLDYRAAGVHRPWRWSRYCTGQTWELSIPVTRQYVTWVWSYSRKRTAGLRGRPSPSA